MRISVKILVIVVSLAVIFFVGGGCAREGIGLLSGYQAYVGVPSSIIPSQRTDQNAWLGIGMKPVTDQEKTKMGTYPAGFLVDFVVPESPAEHYGLKRGDIVVLLNHLPIGSSVDPLKEFLQQIKKESIGAEVSITVIRDGQKKILSVFLGSYPKEPVDRSLYQGIGADEKKTSSLLQSTLNERGLGENFSTVLGMIQETASDVRSFKLYKEGYNPFRLQEINYLLLYPFFTPQVTMRRATAMKNFFTTENQKLSSLLVVASESLDIEIGQDHDDPSGKMNIESFYRALIRSMREARRLREEALLLVSMEDREFLFDKAPFLLSEGSRDDGEELSEDDLVTVLKIALQVDYEKLFASAKQVTDVIDSRSIEGFKPFPAKVFRHEERFRGDVLDIIDSDIGTIVIGGPGTTYYYADAAVIIDLGGDDFYYNNAGGTSLALPYAVVIDRGGNDTYYRKDMFSQGAGFLGAGILIDTGGDDTYVAGSYAQGMGLFGVGILLDREGKDYYSSDCCSQGAGMFGIGLLLEGDGTDSYDASRFAQGFGFTNGFGLIMDIAGDDRYTAGNKFKDYRDPERSFQSMSQGFGFGLAPRGTSLSSSGGIGMLYDVNGNDMYIADYFSQGSSYWYALGILLDSGGNDRYVAGRYSQGAATHSTIGILFDTEGNDQYIASYGVSQGCGHDLAVGVLLDNAGDDYYDGGILVQGAGSSNGLGILYDVQGKDRYHSRTHSQGFGEYFKDREFGSFGLLLNAGGADDSYSAEEIRSKREDNRWGVKVGF